MKSIIILWFILVTSILASDSDLANALAEAGALHATKGHTEQARDSIYRALVYDKECSIALFELAKIEEKEGDKKYAITLYIRALPGLTNSRRDVAETKIKFASPIAAKASAIMEEYARGLDRIIQSKPDPAVAEI